MDSNLINHANTTKQSDYFMPNVKGTIYVLDLSQRINNKVAKTAAQVALLVPALIVLIVEVVLKTPAILFCDLFILIGKQICCVTPVKAPKNNQQPLPLPVRPSLTSGSQTSSSSSSMSSPALPSKLSSTSSSSSFSQFAQPASTRAPSISADSPSSSASIPAQDSLTSSELSDSSSSSSSSSAQSTSASTSSSSSSSLVFAQPTEISGQSISVVSPPSLVSILPAQVPSTSGQFSSSAASSSSSSSQPSSSSLISGSFSSWPPVDNWKSVLRTASASQSTTSATTQVRSYPTFTTSSTKSSSSSSQPSPAPASGTSSAPDESSITGPLIPNSERSEFNGSSSSVLPFVRQPSAFREGMYADRSEARGLFL